MVRQIQETQTIDTDDGVRRETLHEIRTPGPSGLSLATRVVYFALGVIETVLAFRFVLALLGANRSSPFAQLVFNLSHPFAQPFFSLFNYQPTYGVSSVELGTLVAMVVYAILASGIVALLRLPRRGSYAA